MTLSPAREARREELLRASETVTELRRLLAERDAQLGEQVQVNARLAQKVTDLKATIEHNNLVARERTALVEQAAELLR